MPVCGPLDKIAEVRRQADWQECVVVNETRVVLGLLEKEALGANDELPVEEVMDPAPLTLRPYFPWKSVMEKMHARKTAVALVTKPDGKLVGLLRPSKTR